MTAISRNRVQLTLEDDITAELTRSGDTEALVHLLIRSRGSPTLETVLFVGVLLPPKSLDAIVNGTVHTRHTRETHRESLDGQYWSTTPEHAQPVTLLLSIEDRPRGEGDNPGLDTLRFKFRSSLEGDGDLTSGTDDCEILARFLVDDVSTLGRSLDRRSLEVRKVLTGKREDGGCGLGLEGAEVGSRGLVAVGRTPDVDVGHSTEVSESLDRLVGGTVLSKTDGIVSGNPYDLVTTEGGEADGTGGIRDKVLSSAVRGLHDPYASVDSP